ncbi:hypothetical protein OSB04_013963 [Centaurea solstitialis]|uniref:Uncharacterized protein n=1 Tax=Centaurea solstitialis TaxID=347529 RepID=A0AA38TE96_9ASTR|nr:hypothetical protein OSB04_013963 [Centaurea solstitialis]
MSQWNKLDNIVICVFSKHGVTPPHETRSHDPDGRYRPITSPPWCHHNHNHDSCQRQPVQTHDRSSHPKRKTQNPTTRAPIQLPLTEVGLPEGWESFDLVPSAAFFLKLFAAAALLKEPAVNTPAPRFHFRQSFLVDP